jgi:hypothetical protein
MSSLPMATLKWFFPTLPATDREQFLCLRMSLANGLACMDAPLDIQRLVFTVDFDYTTFVGIRSFINTIGYNIINVVSMLPMHSRELRDSRLYEYLFTPPRPWRGVGIVRPRSIVDSDCGHMVLVDFDRNLILDSAVKHAFTLCPASLDVCVSGSDGCRGLLSFYLLTKKKN